MLKSKAIVRLDCAVTRTRPRKPIQAPCSGKQLALAHVNNQEIRGNLSAWQHFLVPSGQGRSPLWAWHPSRLFLLCSRDWVFKIRGYPECGGVGLAGRLSSLWGGGGPPGEKYA